MGERHEVVSADEAKTHTVHCTMRSAHQSEAQFRQPLSLAITYEAVTTLSLTPLESPVSSNSSHSLTCNTLTKARFTQSVSLCTLHSLPLNHSLPSIWTHLLTQPLLSPPLNSVCPTHSLASQSLRDCRIYSACPIPTSSAAAHFITHHTFHHYSSPLPTISSDHSHTNLSTCTLSASALLSLLLRLDLL